MSYPRWFVTDLMVQAARLQSRTYSRLSEATVRDMLVVAMANAPTPSRYHVEGSPVYYEGNRIMLDIQEHMSAMEEVVVWGTDRDILHWAVYLEQWLAQGGKAPDWAAWGGLRRSDLSAADKVELVRAAWRRRCAAHEDSQKDSL